MRILGLCEMAIEQFVERNEVSVSGPRANDLKQADESDMAKIREFEESSNALVYHMIKTHTEIGRADSLLYVCDYEEDWALDWRDILAGQVLAYVINLDSPDSSEKGIISVMRTPAGSLIRIW